jgi:hypothetical protein
MSEPWEIEEAFLVNRKGIDPDKAHVFVVLRWMALGDYRPLAAAIRAMDVMDDAWLALLAEQIEQGRLSLKHQRGGRPKNPQTQIRDITAALLYENDWGGFEEIGNRLGMSEPSVRHALTALRRNAKKPR